MLLGGQFENSLPFLLRLGLVLVILGASLGLETLLLASLMEEVDVLLLDGVLLTSGILSGTPIKHTTTIHVVHISNLHEHGTNV